MKTCQRCGYQWEPRQLMPRSCPACKSYKWNVAREKTPKEVAKEIDESVTIEKKDGVDDNFDFGA